jgi:hypothetical protein
MPPFEVKSSDFTRRIKLAFFALAARRQRYITSSLNGCALRAGERWSCQVWARRLELPVAMDTKRIAPLCDPNLWPQIAPNYLYIAGRRTVAQFGLQQRSFGSQCFTRRTVARVYGAPPATLAGFSWRQSSAQPGPASGWIGRRAITAKLERVVPAGDVLYYGRIATAICACGRNASCETRKCR